VTLDEHAEVVETERVDGDRGAVARPGTPELSARSGKRFCTHSANYYTRKVP